MADTPYDFWAGMWRSGVAMAETGVKFAETMHASRAVVDSRSRTMAAASRDPLNGDYVELGRMVPEKVEAFAAAGMSAMADLQMIQAQALANWQQMIGIAMSGRMASAAQIGELTTRSSRMIERASSAGGKALAPVHLSATNNARRLSRVKPA